MQRKYPMRYPQNSQHSFNITQNKKKDIKVLKNEVEVIYVYGKSLRMPKNKEGDPLSLQNVFSQPKKLVSE